MFASAAAGVRIDSRPMLQSRSAVRAAKRGAALSPTLRNVRQDAAIRAFIRAGGHERAGKGSHRNLKMPNGKIVTLPAGVLRVGLLRHQIKLAGLTEEEFLELL